MVGTSFPYIEFFPKPGQARAVQIELDPVKVVYDIPSSSAWWGIAGAPW